VSIAESTLIAKWHPSSPVHRLLVKTIASAKNKKANRFRIELAQEPCKQKYGENQEGESHKRQRQTAPKCGEVPSV
jgi:hypothetical protein